MSNYKVNPATVSSNGLKFRSAPALTAESILGLLNPGDLLEAIGQPESAPPVVWLQVRVLSSNSIAPGQTGYAALRYASDVYLLRVDEPPANPLLEATARVAELMKLPALLLKAFMGVEGADPNHRDGVLQVVPDTRATLIPRIPRASKLAALNLPADSALSDAALNEQFAQAFVDKNLTVQVMTGAQYIKEQLDRFNGYVALAGLAYNTGPGRAQNVIDTFDGDPRLAALQYHKQIGTAPDQVTVQPGVDSVDQATGVHWIRYPVTANDTGKEIFQYLYLRQVPKRYYGLLDYIFRPALLAGKGLYQNDQPPGKGTGAQPLVVAGGQFTLAGGQSMAMFNTNPLSQRDPQWKNVVLGFGDPSITIGSDGCTLTSLTLVANGFGFNETPATLNEKLKALGPGRGFSDALMVFGGLAAALPGMQLKNFVLCRDSAAPMADIDAALDAGKPVVIELDQSPSPGLQNHWVVLYGRQDGDYLMHDPWPVPAEPGIPLTQRYGFAGAPAQIITAAVFYDNPNFQPQGGTGRTGPITAPVVRRDKLSVAVSDAPDIRAAGGLALRDAPVSGNVKTRLLPGTLLDVREDIAAAGARIGQVGQWLNVSTADNNVGFVAAWLVHAEGPSGAVPFGMETEETTAVKSIQEQLEDTGEKEFASTTQPNPRGNAFAGVTTESAAAAAVAFDLLSTGPEAGAPQIQVIDDPDIAAVGGLALRAAPINGLVTARLPIGTRLAIRENATAGLAKIGQPGQWLSVSTSAGVPGFVAAWYVKQVAGTGTTTPTTGGGPISMSPELIAQGVVIACGDAPLLSAPQAGAPSAWRVTAGTPLRVTEGGNWAAKIGQPNQFVRVQSYAFKDGFVQGSLLQAPAGLDTRVPAVDAQLPFGTCAWLYGLHDAYDRGLFAGSGKTGWVLMTERAVSGAGNTGYEDWSKSGYGVIARLNNDYGGSGTIPTPDQYDTFAAQCAAWVRNSKGCNTWLIANEMNNPREWPEEGRNPGKAVTPELYAACYNKVRAAIKAVQPDSIVIPGALDCFQGPQISCLEWFTRMLAAINDLDGFALHCYTHGPQPNLVTDLGTFDNDPLRWQYYHFRCYTTFLDVIPAKWRNRPVYITETNPYGEQPWAGGQNGWVQTAYAEVNRWNQQPCAQQIRTLILYRWSRDDIFSILARPPVQNDVRATIANTDYRWRH
jgi:hypothetical protein